MSNKRKFKFPFLPLFLILILLLLMFLLILYISPSLLPISPDIAEKIKERAERASSEIEELVSEIEGEKIQELQPDQLPRGVHPERSLYILEKEIFDLMNQERTTRGFNALVWDEGIANTAFKHSKEMGINDYINHTNLAGDFANGRLAKANIFNICNSENIFFIESRRPKTELARKAVDGWLESPGHRKNLLDDQITKGGVGIYCDGRKCYVNANHICTTATIDESLKERFAYFFSLYPEEAEFDISIRINFQISVTSEADIFIIPDSDQYQNFVKRKSYQFTKEYNKVTEVSDIAVVEKGYGFMIVPSEDSELMIEIEYI